MITLRFVYLISVNPGLKHLESKGLKVQKDKWDLGDMMEIWWRYGVDLQFQKTWNIVQKLYGPIVFQGRKSWVWSWTWRKWRHNCKLSKYQSIHNVTKIYIWIKWYSFEGCVHKWIPFLGFFHGFHKKILHWTSVFNFSNNKCFFSCKSSYQNDIWRITWYWRLEYDAKKINMCITYSNRKQLF